MTLTELKSLVENILDDTVDEDFFIDLANNAKYLIETGGTDWEILKAFDTSESATASDTYLTMKTLPTDFAKMISQGFLYVGTNCKYFQVPFEERYKYKNGANKFYIDYANSQYAIIGAIAGTINLPYIKTSDAFTALTESWGFPDRFHRLLAFMIVGYYMGGVDVDTIYARMSPENQQMAKVLRDGLANWNDSIALSAMDWSSAPMEGGVMPDDFDNTLRNS